MENTKVTLLPEHQQIKKFSQVLPPTPPLPPTSTNINAGGQQQQYFSEAKSPQRTEIFKPLSNMGEILYDADIGNLIENYTSNDLATQIWMEYGGNAMGNADNNKRGERVERNNYDPKSCTHEIKQTINSKWKRLPKGKLITDIFQLNDLSRMIEGLIFNYLQEHKSKSQPPPPGGGIPGLASNLHSWVKTSNMIDRISSICSDKLDSYFIK